MRTGLNVRHADEQLRGTIALPNGIGKDVKIAVFAQGDSAREAEEAGADYVGGEDLAKQIREGFDDFDMTIATPDMMSIVGQLGRILGPSGKMPNPKVGTVTTDVAKAVEESKAGKIEYRTDRSAIVHLVIGKASFEERKLLENYAAVIEELVRAKPVGRQRPLPALDHARHHDGPRGQGRPQPHPGHRRGRSRGRLASRSGPPRPRRTSRPGPPSLYNRARTASVRRARDPRHRAGEDRGRHR